MESPRRKTAINIRRVETPNGFFTQNDVIIAYDDDFEWYICSIPHCFIDFEIHFEMSAFYELARDQDLSFAKILHFFMTIVFRDQIDTRSLFKQAACVTYWKNFVHRCLNPFQAVCVQHRRHCLKGLKNLLSKFRQDIAVHDVHTRLPKNLKI